MSFRLPFSDAGNDPFSISERTKNFLVGLSYGFIFFGWDSWGKLEEAAGNAEQVHVIVVFQSVDLPRVYLWTTHALW